MLYVLIYCTTAQLNNPTLLSYELLYPFFFFNCDQKYASEWSRIYYFYLILLFKYVFIAIKFCFQISHLSLNLFYPLHIFLSFLEALFLLFLQIIIYCLNPVLFIKIYIKLTFNISTAVEHEKSKSEITLILLSKQNIKS